MGADPDAEAVVNEYAKWYISLPAVLSWRKLESPVGNNIHHTSRASQTYRDVCRFKCGEGWEEALEK